MFQSVISGCRSNKNGFPNSTTEEVDVESKCFGSGSTEEVDEGREHWRVPS